MVTGSIGSWDAITATLERAAPLICAGLSVTLPFRAGLFNIGAQGQLIVAATCSAYVGFAWDLPVGIHMLAALIAGLLGGAVWGGIVGVLKARTGAHEVITTIMLNYVAAQIVFLALRSSTLRAPGSTAPVSRPMSNFVDIPLILNLPAIRLDWSFVIALLMAAVVSFLLFRTTKGFELRASGFNPFAARYAGMSAGGSMMLAMALSGGLGGLAGSRWLRWR